MYKKYLILSSITIAIVMGGCSFLPGNETEVEQTTTQSNNNQNQQQKSEQSPEVAQAQPVTQNRAFSGLVPSTNAERRVATIVKGRPDPFSLIPIQPKVTIEPKEPKEKESIVPKKSNPPSPPNQVKVITKLRPNPLKAQPKIAVKPQVKIALVPKQVLPKNQTKIGIFPKPKNSPEIAIKYKPKKVEEELKQIPNVLPKKIPKPEQPKIAILPPKPTLAEAVAVTGVIEINGITLAIIKAPEESTSRYVEVGQYLSNGQVLVKRIESGLNSTPLIVLEQYGIEVAKKVGEKPIEITSEKADKEKTSLISGS